MFCGPDDRFGELYIMGGKPRLLDQMDDVIRVKHYSIRTERVHCAWVKQFLRFNRYSDPVGMGAPELEAFLTGLAVRRMVSASTQNQALAALLFLYQQVLAIALPWLIDVVRAKKPERLPVVLSVEEVRRMPGGLEGELGLTCSPLYGAGRRVRRWHDCGSSLRRRIPCTTASRPIYWRVVRTFAPCRNCWAMPM